MSDIKSAREIAMEKAASIGEATAEERLEWKYLPEGERLAASYLKDDITLSVELNRYEEKARQYVKRGASSILIRNINLPRDDNAKKLNRRVMDGLKNLKDNKVAVENTFSKIRRIFQYYVEQGAQQKKQAYASLKADFEAKIAEAVRKQMGVAGRPNIDVEKQPQFQEEWRRMQNQIESQYLNLLNDYRHELAEID
jgi:hypothetical protein